VLREAEAIGAANGPGAHEPPANVRLGPICRGAPIFEGQVERRRSRRTGWLLCVAQDGGSPGWWSGRACRAAGASGRPTTGTASRGQLSTSSSATQWRR
jgi:hypothetical protein